MILAFFLLSGHRWHAGRAHAWVLIGQLANSGLLLLSQWCALLLLLFFWAHKMLWVAVVHNGPQYILQSNHLYHWALTLQFTLQLQLFTIHHDPIEIVHQEILHQSHFLLGPIEFTHDDDLTNHPNSVQFPLSLFTNQFLHCPISISHHRVRIHPLSLILTSRYFTHHHQYYFHTSHTSHFEGNHFDLDLIHFPRPLHFLRAAYFSYHWGFHLVKLFFSYSLWAKLSAHVRISFLNNLKSSQR